jgi:hypothetical protein
MFHLQIPVSNRVDNSLPPIVLSTVLTGMMCWLFQLKYVLPVLLLEFHPYYLRVP